MSWLFFALLAPALDTLVIFMDKYVVEHRVKDSHAMPIYLGLAAAIIATILWLAFGMPGLNAHNGLLLLASGISCAWAAALYFHALLKSEASYINAVLQTTPIFILILSILFLDQPLGWLQVVGFVLVSASVMGMSVDHVERKIKLDTAFYQILGANGLFAVAYILVAFTADVPGLLPIMIYGSWGVALGALSLFIVFGKVRRSFLSSFRGMGKSTLSLILLNESVMAFSQAIAFLAITLGPVALVGVLNGTQVFYGLLLGLVLTRLFPKIFHENIDKRAMKIKGILSIVLFIGVVCIGQAS